MQQIRYAILLGGLLILVAGCSSGKPVNAVVTMDGKPFGGAQVVLYPEDGKETIAISGTSEADGKVVLMGPKGAGVPSGTYKVIVTKRSSTGAKTETVDPKDAALMMKGASAKTKSEVHPKYGQAKQTPLTLKVPPDSEPAKIELRTNPG